jgi:hypothetical protein
MKKLFSAKRYNSSDLRVVPKPTVRLRSVDDCRVEERRSSSPRACLAFSALSIWSWIGGTLSRIVRWIPLDCRSSRLPEGAARLKRL